MLNRSGLVRQMAKVFADHPPTEDVRPDDDDRKRAEEALEMVERYLGRDIEDAQSIIQRVLEDVT
jgi:hypothetical protein